MAKQYFIPKQQAPYVLWHDNLKNGVTATTPGATAADVTMLATDNRPLLVAGKPETRQYKAVFFIGKAETGLPSAIVTAIAAP